MNSLLCQERNFDPSYQGQYRLFEGGNSGLALREVDRKKVLVDFSGGTLTSDAGLLLLKEVNAELGLTDGAASALCDDRDSRYTRHSVAELIRQRVFQIAAGYEDANDSDVLRNDPIMKMAADRLPISGPPLASQPTISRFENAPTRTELYRMGAYIVDQFVASYDEAPELIVLDFDDTDNPVYGEQQLALFNRHYNKVCYEPLHVYEGLSGRLITAVLKPKRSMGATTLMILKRIVRRLRSVWPQTLMVFRADCNFLAPEVIDWIDEQEQVMYVIGIRSNPVLRRRIQPLVKEAKRLYERCGGRTIRRYHSIRYKAGSWSALRRVIVKIEVSSGGYDVRRVVTNMETARARALYEKIYCGRGRAESFIKEHKRYLCSHRTSCHRFEANQFRLFLHSLAYNLCHAFRSEVLRGTQWATATFETIRLKLFKLGARVRELKTRIKVELPSSCPAEPVLRRSISLFALLRPG
jgi:hypothetical protein